MLLTFTLAFLRPASANEVMLQYFESRWETIEKKTPDAFVAGYASFWFPPPGQADTGGFSVGYDVYDRFNLGKPFDQTLYGTESSLKQMVDSVHRAGMKAYFDYVMNHNGFRDSSTPGFVAAGDYPGFVTTLPGDIDGDFHGVFEGGDLNMRLAGLIDIAQEKNHQFIRQPAVAGPQNIPNEQPNPDNRRFYPDLSLPANSIGIHPFNLADPSAGDPIMENATGLLLRNAQWMVEVVGADGFRMDAVKHVPTWFFSTYFDTVMYQRGGPDLAGNPTTPFSFGEVFDGSVAKLADYRREDGFGNRDVLDFPLFFAMRDVLNANGFGDMTRLIDETADAMDGTPTDGSAGVMFAQSHDEFGPELANVAYAHILTRPGVPVVYFNALEFGTNRDFPKDGSADALGGTANDILPTLVDISRRYAKGTHVVRSSDTDVYVYERSNSLIVGLNDRQDSGYDERVITTDFRNVVLTELTGAATDPIVDPSDDIPTTISVNSAGQATIRVPRNHSSAGVHNRGFVMYGLAPPAHTQTVTPFDSVMFPDPPSVPNGIRRLTPIQVITADAFTITAQTDGIIAENNALLKLDGGLDIDDNPGLFLDSGEFAGFEEFTDLASPRTNSGTGAYQLTIDATTLKEGAHFLETVAFLPRPTSAPAVFSSKRSALYLDRLPPTVALAQPTTTGSNDVQSPDFTVIAKSSDATANSMHVFFDKPPSFDFVGNVNGSNSMTRSDRDEFRFNWTNIAGGDHSITIVAFEPTGTNSVTRFEPVNASASAVSEWKSYQ